MILVIAGHQRSGTTLLGRLCGAHPELAVTNEFGNMLPARKPYVRYSYRIMRRWLAVGNRWAFEASNVNKKRKNIHNLSLVTRYLYMVYRHSNGSVDMVAIGAALHSMFPHARHVGDKWPAYTFMLDDFIRQDGVLPLVIYRDCRDVVGSTLRLARTMWRDMSFAKEMDTAEKIAARWVRAIDIAERHRDRMYCIRYEELVSEPKRVLEDLGSWLGVAPSGFPVDMITDRNIGKHKQELTPDELKVVLKIAGPTMSRLCYL